MKVLLLDKNKLNMDILEETITKAFNEITMFKYTTAFSFITGIYDELKGDADLVIMHIEDDKDENIRMARDIQEYFPHIKVIFYSENRICAESVFLAMPSFFFRLPSEDKVIFNALERINKNIIYDNNSSLKIVSKGQIIKLKYEEINYMESAGRKICIYSTSGNFETSSTMDDMMKQLPEYFYKCHRSYIVNLYKVTSITKLGISVLGKSIIPYSRDAKEELRIRLHEI